MPRTASNMLQQQLDQIAQECTSNLVDVIVQMESSRSHLKTLGHAAGQAIRRRRMTLNPRDVLPAGFSTRSAPSPKEKNQSASTRTLLGHADSETLSLKALRKVGMDSMQNLESTKVFRTAMARMAKPSRRSSPDRPTPKPFWTSRAMPMQLAKSELMELAGIPNIKSVRLNRKLHLPPLMEAKPLAAESENILSAAWGLQAINALSAWGVYGVRGKGALVGVLDTGVDAEHPDLKGKVAHWQEFDSFGNPVAGDPRDSDEHGTHCAGTIVGGNSSGRYIGVAPDAKIAAALVLDGDTGGSDAQVLAGIDWAVEKGVNVLSMSLGGLQLDQTTPPTYTEAILSCIEAGIPVVVAIGNDGEQTTGSPGSDLFALSVGAVDHNMRVAGFSGGRTQILLKSDFIDPQFLPLPYSKPEVSAPGVAIQSCVPGNTWKSFSGTSMATPHVAGAIALLLSATDVGSREKGSRLAFTLRDLIIGTVNEQGESGQDHRYGFGTIDVLRAIDFAKQRGY